MFDISFYMRMKWLEKADYKIVNQNANLFMMFDLFRNKNPIVYNIETTNACNMKCKMCPRTTMMTRPIETMKPELFEKIVNQLNLIDYKLWKEWNEFTQREYGIGYDSEPSENHFFLHVIPRVIQLHGYGDPLLDKNMARYVKLLTDRGFQSYFSCNPANIDIEKTVEMFANGLSYIKYSIESTRDDIHKEIRGSASNFSESYAKICQLLDIKRKCGYKTVIVITMLDLNAENQAEEYVALKKAFDGKDVYLYLKSEDTQWYRKDYHGTKSIHWSEFCKHPWMSMTIKSNGEACMCMEDFNNEIILGDANTESLYDIWNGEKYRQFRQDHFDKKPGLRCTERCDMKMIGDLI
ncbi:MAG: SPASM domain-containing protein [Candidatus Nanoarchaeia archaeon]|nr:SPASM domain-containing protein [Candidatus Nanoarchaeia archaeon]